PDLTPGVRLAQEAEKALEVVLPQVWSARHDSVASPWIEGAKEHAFGVLPRDRDPRLLSAQGPGSTNLRQQPEDGFVLKKPHGVGRHGLHFPHDGRLFFAPRGEPFRSRSNGAVCRSGRPVSSSVEGPKDQ